MRTREHVRKRHIIRKMKDDDALRSVIESLDKTLGHIQDKLKSAHVLNGGFDRLMEKVVSIEGTQEKILGEVNTIKETIYDPDEGIYSRIKGASDDAEDLVQGLDKAMIGMQQQITDLKTWKSNVSKLMWAIIVPLAGTFGKILYDVITQHVQLK